MSDVDGQASAPAAGGGKFERLQGLEIAGKTISISVTHISPNAKLTVRPATDANPEYLDALLQDGEEVTRGVVGQRATKDVTDHLRERAKRLYVDHVIVGWEGILYDDGAPAPFSKETCRALLDKLPGWIFDRIRRQCEMPETFLPKGSSIAGK